MGCAFGQYFGFCASAYAETCTKDVSYVQQQQQYSSRTNCRAAERLKVCGRLLSYFDYCYITSYKET